MFEGFSCGIFDTTFSTFPNPLRTFLSPMAAPLMHFRARLSDFNLSYHFPFVFPSTQRTHASLHRDPAFVSVIWTSFAIESHTVISF
jgi:hypothetical protein